MSDLTYRVLIDIGTKGGLTDSLSGAHRKAVDLDSSLKRVGDAARTVGGQMAGAFTSAVESAGALVGRMGMLAGAAGLAGVTYGVVKLNAALESAQIGIAAIFNAQGLSSNMTDAMKMAGGQMEHLRKQAAELPGEFGDLRQFFTLGLNQALNKGMDVDKFREMAGNAMATAASVGVPMDQAAREFAQLLGGRSGTHNVFGSQLGLQGAKSQEFNAATPAKQVETLTALLAKFNPAIATFKTGWEGLSSTAVDNVKRFGQMATAPLFGRIKQTFSEFNNWFDGNGNTWQAWANKIGRELAHAFDVGKAKVMEWAPVFATFAGNAWDKLLMFWVQIEPIVARVADLIKSAMLDPGTFDRIGDMLKLYTAVKIGGAVAPAVGSSISAFGSLAGGGGAAMAGLGIAEVGAAAAVALPVLAALAGIMHTLADETSKYHDYEVKEFEKAKKAADELAQKFGPTGLMGALDALGAGAIAWADFVINKTPNIYTALNVLGNAAQFLGLYTPGMTETSQNAWKASGTEREVDLGSHGGYAMGQAARATAADSFGRQKLPPMNITQNFKVELVVNQNQDPMRVAELVMDKMDDISRKPTRSSRSFTR